jgi:wyosine [tRNA(Phe)-imidazoG37] synthetase (radical SAM superfamily)
MKADDIFPNSKTVYGPVSSWRFGASLGIDPIFETSTCSFNCIYCQLGNIQKVTSEIKDYVPTNRVLEDFKEAINNNPNIDVITYSGSGEPTLAKNLGEIIKGIRKIAPSIPQYILTNATLLNNPIVIENLMLLDKVILKLDAGNEEIFQLINRPEKGITLDGVIKGILEFRKHYKGSIEVQSMFMPINMEDLESFANLLKEINPDFVQLNTPKRAYPLSWERENRGNHLGIHLHKTANLKIISETEALEIEKKLSLMTELKILSVFRENH